MTRGISSKEALELMELPDSDVPALVARAALERRRIHGDGVRMCAITNAKSGRCPERCDFCAQSVHFATDIPVFPMKDAGAIAAEARGAASAGVCAFSIVTSGRALTRESDLCCAITAITAMRDARRLEPCASLGELGRDALARLRDAGLRRYHHNVEAPPSFHSRIVHTHSWDDEVRVVADARDLGLEVCCGGILGMGETREQRVELAFALLDLAPDSVPLNFLDPRPGTPLEHIRDLTATECLKIIAVFRLVMPRTGIIICGGRQFNLGAAQERIFDAGATGLMVGDYLTTCGQPLTRDREMIVRAGYRIAPPDLTGRHPDARD